MHNSKMRAAPKSVIYELYDLFYKPFVTYADEHGTALTDEQINTLYGKDVTDSSSEE